MYATLWMDLESIMLSEIGQPQKTLCDFHFVWFHLYELSRIGKSIETENKLVVALGREGQEISRGRGVLGNDY